MSRTTEVNSLREWCKIKRAEGFGDGTPSHLTLGDAEALLSALDAAREGALRERNEAADVSREAYIGSVERVVKALAAGAPMCLTCGKPATCVGAYECSENLDFGCEECCSHGNEDGWCVPLASRPEPEPAGTPAGTCTGCEGPVYHRPGMPGEFDHECACPAPRSTPEDR